MMKRIFLCCLLFVAADASAQKGRRRAPPPPPGIADSRCYYAARYTPAQRRGRYPFSVADTVRLVSFRYHCNHYPVSRAGLLRDSLVESVALAPAQVDELTALLYNNGFRGNLNIVNGMGCFEPRNALVFLDAAGAVKEWVLLCFHCSNKEASSERVAWGDECSDKMELLRALFRKRGLRFGTDLSVTRYPGEDGGSVPPADPSSPHP